MGIYRLRIYPVPESRRLFPNPEESCFPLVKNSTIVRVIPSSGLVFLPARPGGGPAAIPISSYQQPEPEQLFPVSTPAALFTSDSPGNTSSPGNSQTSIVAPNPNNSSGYYPDSLLAPVAAGPAGILTRTIYRLIYLQQCYYNHWYTKYCCWLRCLYLSYPEQFVGLFPAAAQQ